MEKRLLMIVNSPDFFMSHFYPIAEAAKAAGYDVHVASMNGPAVEHIENAGIKHTAIPMTRSGKGIFNELRTLIVIWFLLWRIRPDVLHLMTIKPVLYGGIAARFAPVGGVLSVITGLGFVFLGKGLNARLLQFFVGKTYRVALSKKNLRVVFENPDDCKALIRLGALDEARTELVRGAGVDLVKYAYVSEKEGCPVVCLAARLLRDKGVVEFVEAAYKLRRKGIKARFQLIGDTDPGNPATITAREMDEWQQDGMVELLGYRADIPQLFADANIIVLPSYREGLPKVLLEAAACGRAVITTDVPGCRHAIIPGVTGFLVPARSIEKLAESIETLLTDSVLRHRMGRAGRLLAESEYSVSKIVHQYLAIYRKLEQPT